MSKAETAKDKAARLAAGSRRRQVETAADAVELAPLRASRAKPVRMTLDLATALHAEFEDWTVATNRQRVGRRVNRADVMRVLVRQLLDDPDIQRRVVAALDAEAR